MTFKPITEAYVHGVTATVGNRKAEVIRAYAGEWHAFLYQDGQMLRGEGQSVSRSEAMRQAKAFLSHKPNASTGKRNPLTLKEAKDTFADLMAKSRERTLTPAELNRLRSASQLIRYHRRTTSAANKPRRVCKVSSRVRARSDGHENPRGTLIYEKVTRIEGTKGRKSLYPGQKFFHNFKRPYPKMYGLPDGSLLIK